MHVCLPGVSLFLGQSTHLLTLSLGFQKSHILQKLSVADIMERRKVDVFCVQKTRRKGSKARTTGCGFKLWKRKLRKSRGNRKGRLCEGF